MNAFFWAWDLARIFFSFKIPIRFACGSNPTHPGTWVVLASSAHPFDVNFYEFILPSRVLPDITAVTAVPNTQSPSFEHLLVDGQLCFNVYRGCLISEAEFKMAVHLLGDGVNGEWGGLWPEEGGLACFMELDGSRPIRKSERAGRARMIIIIMGRAVKLEGFLQQG